MATATYSVAAPTGTTGSTDWIDLAADQCTLFYTGESTNIKRFNACTNTQGTDFATGLTGDCYALRIRNNGEVLMACQSIVYRLSSSGTTLQTYTRASLGETGDLFGLNLDPDGTTFWTASDTNHIVYHVDIVTGAKLGSFNGSQGNTAVFGLALFGEPRAAQSSGPSPSPAASVVPALPRAGTQGPNDRDLMLGLPILALGALVLASARLLVRRRS